MGMKLTRVMFAHDVSKDVAPYRRYFGATVHFDSAYSELILSARWLERPITGADLSRRMAAERIALAAEQGDDGRLLERVQSAVHGLVMAGQRPRSIAELLGVHERVLRRRWEQTFVRWSVPLATRAPASCCARRSCRWRRSHPPWATRTRQRFRGHSGAGPIRHRANGGVGAKWCLRVSYECLPGAATRGADRKRAREVG
jgi:hypothetical protein